MIDRTTSGQPAGGFTFLEILVVMAVMGILMGIGIGYLQNIGAGSRVDQARAILRETVYACKQSSNGGARAILDLREQSDDASGALVVSAAVARPVLTHNFEMLDSTSRGYTVDIDGEVEIDANGYMGNCARFGARGRLVFDPQSAFAMTEGLRIDIQVQPGTGAGTMTILEGEGAYELQLAKGTRSDGYDVVLDLDLKEAGRSGRSAGLRTRFQTKGGPVRADGSWTRLEVSYNGVDASIRIDGIEHAPSRPATATSGAIRRMSVPAGGAVKLVLGGTDTPYVGLMDTLVLGGVFRSADADRDLYGLRLVRPQAPLRVIYRNGRLDPAEHSGDVVLLLQETTNPDGPMVEFRLGLYGTVDERLVTGRGPR